MIVSTSLVRAQCRAYASFCCLGLKKSALVQKALPSLQKLPDVIHAVKNPLEPQALDSLQRAYEIFDHIHPGSPKSQALLALTADVQVMRGESPLKTLEQLLILLEEQTPNDNKNKALIRLAIAKVYWMQGDFLPAAALCRQVLEENCDASAAARNGHALCQLLIASTTEDLYFLRDPVRRNDWSYLPLAQLNFGAAEVLYGDLWRAYRPDTEMNFGPALRQWKEGLDWYEKNDRKDNMALLLHSQLNVNMAWGLLQQHDVEQASKYAHAGLTVLEKEKPSVPLTLPLTLLAQCYHRSGDAITAEGLFQTAISIAPRTLSEKLQLRYALRSFAMLCSDWEKRRGDAERLLSQADHIDLPEPWRNKESFVHTSLWFWMPFQS